MDTTLSDRRPESSVYLRHLRRLYDNEAHLVILENPDDPKAASEPGWAREPAAWSDVQASVFRGKWIGFVPESLSLLWADVDRDKSIENHQQSLVCVPHRAAKTRAHLGEPLAECESGSGARHLIYARRRALPFNKVFGPDGKHWLDLIHGPGQQVVLYDPAAAVRAMDAAGAAPEADVEGLPAALGGSNRPKPKRAKAAAIAAPVKGDEEAPWTPVVVPVRTETHGKFTPEDLSPEAIAATPEGSRHTQLFEAIVNLGWCIDAGDERDGWLKSYREAARASGLPEREVNQVIADALASNRVERGAERRADGLVTPFNGGHTSAPAGDGGPQAKVTPVPRRERMPEFREWIRQEHPEAITREEMRKAAQSLVGQDRALLMVQEYQDAKSGASGKVKFKSLADVSFERDVDTVVPGVAFRGLLGLLFSGAGAGKTTLMANAVSRITTGKDFLGGPTEQGNVIMLTEDERSVQIVTREAGADLTKAFFIGWDDRVAAVKALKPVAVFVDTLQHYMLEMGSADDNDAGSVGAILHPLNRMARDHNCAVVVFDHAGWQEGGPKSIATGIRPRGSSAKCAVPDYLLRMEMGHTHAFIHRGHKVRIGLDVPPCVTVSKTGEAVHILREDSGQATVSAVNPNEERAAAILAALPTADDAGLTVAEIVLQVTGKNARSADRFARKVLEKAVLEGSAAAELRDPDALASPSNPMTYRAT